MDVNPLITKLAGVRSRIRLLFAGNSLCMFVATAGIVAAASFLLDWLFHLPFGARAVMLLIIIGIMLRGAYQSFLKPFSISLSDDAVALYVQSRNPQYGDSLISAIQLSRSLSASATTESHSMIAATVAATTKRFAGEDFRGAVSPRNLVKPALVALMLGILVCGYASLVPAHAGLWFNRVILLGDQEWPPDTVLEVRIANLDLYRHAVDEDGNYEVWVPEGSVVLIEAQAIGVIPDSVRLHKFELPREENPRPITIELPGQLDSDLFEYRFGRVNESFGFYVEGSDDTDEKPYFTVNVRTAPRVEELLVDYDFPDYINEVGREDREGIREYNVVGPQGTEVAMRFRTSTDVVKFEIIVDEDESTAIELERSIDDARVFLWEFQLDQDHFYTYRLTGANGAPSREAPNFNISSQPDAAPDIAIQRPDTTTVDVTPNATLPLKFQVVDDYRVGQVAMRWDSERGGAFAQQRTFTTEEIRIGEEMRDSSVFSALAVEQLLLPGENGPGAPAIGQRVLLKLEATDTRSTSLVREPNTTVYPSLIVLNVREGSEIERDLTRSQIRVKGQIARIENNLAIKLEELLTLEKELKSEGDGPKDTTERLNAFISAGALLTSGLHEAARGFVRVFDGYLFNRIDESNLTETLIAEICSAHRLAEGTHLDHIARVLPRQRSLINDSEAMGKLALIMDQLLDCSRIRAANVDAALKRALDEQDASIRVTEVSKAKTAQEELLASLRLILEKMEDWEDFQDVIQSLKDIIELEKGLQNRIKKIAR